MMRSLVVTSVLLLYIGFIVCPPVTEKAKEEKEDKDDNDTEEPEDLVSKLSYERYLKEVMSELMTDDSFAKKLMETKDIADKGSDIAQHLEFVGHGVRTKLDEIKRKEVDRVRQLIRLQDKLKQGMKTAFGAAGGIGIEGMKTLQDNLPKIERDMVMGHVDHRNPNTFEIADLEKLMKKAIADLDDLDKKRRQEFKTYEMEKEHLRREKLKEMDEAQQAAEQKKFEEMKQKHKDHPKLHHPGSKDQLEEVWEESDGMDPDDFNPAVFFKMHDIDNDGNLDEREVEALFQKELDKVYNEDMPEDDMIERFEEMSRMREHILKELDKDSNKLISYKEFLDSTKDDDFNKDEGWDTLSEEEIFTDDELAEFEREYEERKTQMEKEGLRDVADSQVQPGNVNKMQQDIEQRGQQVPEVPQLMQQEPSDKSQKL